MSSTQGEYEVTHTSASRSALRFLPVLNSAANVYGALPPGPLAREQRLPYGHSHRGAGGAADHEDALERRHDQVVLIEGGHENGAPCIGDLCHCKLVGAFTGWLVHSYAQPL